MDMIAVPPWHITALRRPLIGKVPPTPTSSPIDFRKCPSIYHKEAEAQQRCQVTNRIVHPLRIEHSEDGAFRFRMLCVCVCVCVCVFSTPNVGRVALSAIHLSSFLARLGSLSILVLCPYTCRRRGHRRSRMLHLSQGLRPYSLESQRHELCIESPLNDKFLRCQADLSQLANSALCAAAT